MSGRLSRELNRILLRYSKLATRNPPDREKMKVLFKHARCIAAKLSSLDNGCTEARILQRCKRSFDDLRRWQNELDVVRTKIGKLTALENLERLTVFAKSRLVTLEACAKGIEGKLLFWNRFNEKIDVFIAALS